MRVILRALAHFAAVTALMILAGCGDAPPSVQSSTTEATVKGVVKVDGVPAKDGEVVFDPTNYKRPSATPKKAPIGPDGSYSITTLIGENTVKIGGAVAQKYTILQQVRKSCDVQGGENTFDLDLSSK